jgi:hypothetical protein
MWLKIVPAVLVAASACSAFDHTHELYDTLLHRYVCIEGVELDSMRSDTLIPAIKAHFESVAKGDYNAWEPDKRLAFLLNMYNFYTLIVIFDNYSRITKSIKDIAEDPLEKKFIPFLGGQISLNYILHELLRKKFEEPRIHFALATGEARSAPSLFEQAYYWENVDWQLDTVAIRFLTEKLRQKNRIEGKTVWLAKMFEWYGGDFNEKYTSCRKYVTDLLGLKGQYVFDFLEFDWSLNKVRRCR